jgi:peptide subunit release factor 1 (eRF1)
MFYEQELHDLIDYRPDHPVLSVYLNLDPTLGNLESNKLRLRQMLKPYEGDVPDDIERIERFIEHEYDWSGRSLIIFSCAADDSFRHYTFPIAMRDRARLFNRPYVKPLAALLDNYGHYGVAIVDRQGARLFSFHLGQLQEQEGVLGEEVRHTKSGGGSQAAGSRGGVAGQSHNVESIAGRNLKEAAQFAARFFNEHKVRRVLLGGTDANLAQFVEQLPKRWQSLVIGTFPIDMTANPSLVLEKAMEAAAHAEADRERRLAEAVITAAAKGAEGTIGLDDTLGAVHSGNVQTLIVTDGFRAGGYRCQGCGFLTAQAVEKCPFCDSSLEAIEDAVELAVRQVMSTGGEVEIIQDNPKLEKAGKIGALLRY